MSFEIRHSFHRKPSISEEIVAIEEKRRHGSNDEVRAGEEGHLHGGGGGGGRWRHSYRSGNVFVTMQKVEVVKSTENAIVRIVYSSTTSATTTTTFAIENNDSFMSESSFRRVPIKVLLQPKCSTGEGDEEGRQEEEEEGEEREESGFGTNARTEDPRLGMRVELDDSHSLVLLRVERDDCHNLVPLIM